MFYIYFTFFNDSLQQLGRALLLNQFRYSRGDLLKIHKTSF